MKPAQAKAIYKDCIERGWQEIGNTLYPPAQAERLQGESGSKPVKNKNRSKGLKRTNWIDDDLNIKNKAKYSYQFDMLLKIETGLEVWNEFRFTSERRYRIDKAIPVDLSGKTIKIALEIHGGIWRKGGGAHSRPANIERDHHKSTLLNLDGWTLIICSPQEIKKQPGKVIDLIKKAIGNKQ